MALIIHMLQTKRYTTQQICDKISHIMGENWSRSIIEKDIHMLRNEFDCPIERHGHRICIIEPYDFEQKIKEWINFFV